MRHVDALAGLARLAAHPELADPARAVYMALIIRSDDDGWCWPGVARLAADTGLHPGTVRKARRALVDAGLMLVEITAGGRRADTTNVYRLPVEVVPTPRPRRGVEPSDPAPPARSPRATSALTPRRGRDERFKQNVERTGAPRPDPELDGHEHHRPGECAECDAGRARVARMLGDLSVWTPTNDPRIGRWST